MNQRERRLFLVKQLLSEEKQYRNINIPSDDDKQKKLLRALMNMRLPKPIDKYFLQIQNEYLQEANKEKGIVRLANLAPIQESIYLWQGDITRLAVDAIVNAANSGMTGCYIPNHTCIDNCIHTYGGMQMRLDCARIIDKQGYDEIVGKAKITSAHNLPCKYVLHTVGPIIQNNLQTEDEEQLASCYQSCLTLAEKKGLASVAFCCISTGVFHFPNQRAAEIALSTVKQFQKQAFHKIEVVFNVFKKSDYDIYKELLC